MNLYIITGPAGVGKSTVSNSLANKLKKSALIEGDDIYNQVKSGYISAWKEGNHLDVFWKICIENIKIYLKNGYDVVFNYIVTPDILPKLREEFKNYNIKFVILLTDEKTLLNRDKTRPEDVQMKERCIVLLNSFKEKNYDERHILDTSILSVDETVNTILNDDKFYLYL